MAQVEYGRAGYCDATNSGPAQGGGEEAGVMVGIRWWEQEIIDLAGAKETAAAVAGTDEDGMEE